MQYLYRLLSSRSLTLLPTSGTCLATPVMACEF